jgi:signal transduction histidine kinase
MAGFFATGFLLAQAPTTELPELTKVRQIRALEPREAGRGYPVCVRGVVTFHEPWSYLTFLQDDTGGIYVAADRYEFRTPGLQAGQLVEVEGVSDMGTFAPIIDGPGGQNAVVRVLGSAPFPKPVPLPSDPVLQAAQEGQWTEVLGTVRTTSVWQGIPVLEIRVAEKRVKLMIPGLLSRTNLPAHLTGARIKAEGVLASEINSKGDLSGIRLLTPSPDWVEFAEAPPTDLFSLPVRSVKSLLRFSPQQKGTLVRVKGVVTFPSPGKGFFISDDEGGILVRSRQTDHLDVGQRVDVVGFPSVEGGFAILEDSIFRAGDVGPAPEPLRLAAEEIVSGGHHAELVSVEATLLDHSLGPREQVLTMQAGGAPIHARLAAPLARKAWATLRPGSLFKVIGICQLPSPPLGQDVAAVGFDLQLRDAEDLVLLSSPPRWKFAHLLWMLAGSLALSLMASAWAILLRRQVNRQTVTIRRHLEERAVAEERSRIARDLHDTFGQEMVGILMQLDAAVARLPHAPEGALRHLEAARGMIRHGQAEARRSVWNLRASELEDRDLPTALRGLVSPLSAEGAKPRIELEVLGTPRRLAGLIEDHLLHISQEALTNAMKYAQAERVRIELSFAPAEVRLRVQDDGGGFDATDAMAAASRHWGLLGMRERAEKVNGKITIASAPRTGTEINVTVPLNGARQYE